ncbi:DUF4254 domain-containing protein [Nocardia sp. NBC_01499]|uniref:DUF4254 domain-containing protein n=1 Tax=Nocardia sp. NBC_01499 TaxID=2903597 RepID=UPI00386A638F
MSAESSLPMRNLVLAACRGVIHEDHPLLVSAWELTNLHDRRLTADTASWKEIDEERAKLVEGIDRWVNEQLPPALGAAYLHTETVGAVIDRLAQFTACAYTALVSMSDWDLWNAWERLAELAVGYEDLRAEVSAGRRRLPRGR